MANRRMFAKTITNSSRFLMMPLSAQALYFQLGMNADDDGYVEHFTIMRMVGGNPDDLNLLVAKSFVKVFDNHVLVIIEWEQHNKIQPSRKIASQYIDVYPSSTECQQVVNNIPTQVRLGKVRLGKKDTVENDLIPYKEILEYLNKVTGKRYRYGKKNNEHIRARWNEGHRVDDFKKVIDIKDEEWRDDPKMAKFRRPSTLFGTKFDEYLNQTAGDKAKKPVTAPSYSRDYTQEKK